MVQRGSDWNDLLDVSNTLMRQLSIPTSVMAARFKSLSKEVMMCGALDSGRRRTRALRLAVEDGEAMVGAGELLMAARAAVATCSRLATSKGVSVSDGKRRQVSKS